MLYFSLGMFLCQYNVCSLPTSSYRLCQTVLIHFTLYLYYSSESALTFRDKVYH